MPSIPSISADSARATFLKTARVYESAIRNLEPPVPQLVPQAQQVTAAIADATNARQLLADVAGHGPGILGDMARNSRTHAEVAVQQLQPLLTDAGTAGWAIQQVETGRAALQSAYTDLFNTPRTTSLNS